MSASTKKRVPWITRSEFVQVYRKLYSGVACEQKQALNHIALWQTRHEADIPLAVTCSADLILAKSEHARFIKEQHISEYQLRQTYTLALVRFVNFITDKYQKDQSNVVISLHKIAAGIGIPDWIISLRHEGTHRAIPSLEVLSRGADWTIRWLQEGFWERQVTVSSKADNSRKVRSRHHHDHHQSGEMETKERVSHLIAEYKQHRFQELSGKRFSKEDLDTGTEGQALIQDFSKLFKKESEVTLNVLIQLGHLPPTVEQLRDMGLEPDNSPFEKIMWTLAIFWCPLLREMNRLHSTSSLIDEFASSLDSSSKHYIKMAHVWLCMFVAPYNITFPGGKSEMLFSHQISVSELSTLQQCLEWPCEFTQKLLKMFMRRSRSSLKKKLLLKLCDLLDVYVQERSKETQSDETPTLYSLKDILQGRKEISQNKESSSSPWQQCTGSVDWSRVPLGILPGQNLDNLYNDLHLGTADARPRLADTMEFMDETMPMETTDEACEVMSCTIPEEEVIPVFKWTPQHLTSIQNKISTL